MQLAANLGGFVYVGFTSRDPQTILHSSGSLAKIGGFWSWFFPKDLCTWNALLFFYFGDDGKVHYGVENTTKGVFDGRIRWSENIYGFFDIFGNSTAVRIVEVISQSSEEGSKEEERERLGFNWHKVHGLEVVAHGSRVQRINSKYSQGYVFSAKPLMVNQRFHLKIGQAMSGSFQGLLHLGITSADPNTLHPADLPSNANLLVDRPEYWVVLSEFTRLQNGDEIILDILPEGQVQLMINNSKSAGISHIDSSLPLYIWLNICGSMDFLSAHLTSASVKLGLHDKDKEKECVVCLDHAIEATLYRCGHTCMCFECAVEQWQGKGGGHCPLCRALIRDVVKIIRK